MKHNSVVIDTTLGIIQFHHLTMQVTSTAAAAGAKPHSVLTEDTLTIKPMTTKTIRDFLDHPSE